MNLYPLYIDPGTGSMLFSIVIGVTATLYFVLRALFIKVKIFISGGRAQKGSQSKYVIYAEDKRYWSLFWPVVEEFEKRGIALLYLTSSRDDPVFESNLHYTAAELLGEGNKAFTRLNFISADFILATTPGLDVYQWKRSKTVKHYSHLFHSADEPVKYELFGIDYYDSILVSGGEHQKDDIRKLEKLRNLPEKEVITVGCPYLDVYAQKIKQLPPEEDHIFTVLVSPSWGRSALLSRYGEKLLDPLVNSAWHIIVRPHPQSLLAEKSMIDRLTARYQNSANLEWDYNRENIFSLHRADIMISDFSGIILDYLFLRNKPVIYVSQNMDLRPYDAYDIYTDQEEMWTFKALRKAGIELKPELLEELPDFIQKLSSDTALESAIAEVKSQAWHHQGNAGKLIADFMISTVNKG